MDYDWGKAGQSQNSALTLPGLLILFDLKPPCNFCNFYNRSGRVNSINKTSTLNVTLVLELRIFVLVHVIKNQNCFCSIPPFSLWFIFSYLLRFSLSCKIGQPRHRNCSMAWEDPKNPRGYWIFVGAAGPGTSIS